MKILLNTRQNTFWAEQTAALQDRLDAEIISAGNLFEVPETFRRETEILVTYGMTAEALQTMPALRLIGLPMAGVNTLPLVALQERDILITNAHANGRWVAERGLTLLLAAAGNLLTGDRALRQGRWHGFAAGEPADTAWRSLYRLKIAIIGTGSIGQWTARFLRPFEPEIRGVRRRPGVTGIPTGLFDRIDTDIDAAFAWADAVIVTLPSTAETAGLIDRHRLHMLEGGIIVNVGRGDVIAEEALFRAAASGTITAAIDTWWDYPSPPGTRQFPSRFPLETLDTVIFSPHLGGYTDQATRASGVEIMERIAGWIEGGCPSTIEHSVDPVAGY